MKTYQRVGALSLVSIVITALAGCFPDPPALDGEAGELGDAADGVQEGDSGDVAADLEDDDVAASNADLDDLDQFDGLDAAQAGDDIDVAAEPNACGGDGELMPGEPGALCGVCSDGELACALDDTSNNTTICMGASALNACGGCGPIANQLGDDCGECGLYGCDPGGTKEVVCVEPESGCQMPLTCADLACESSGRECVEPSAEGDDAACGDCLEGHVTVGDACLLPPATPLQVTATTDRDDSVEIDWHGVAGASDYRVLRCDDAECSDDQQWEDLAGPVAAPPFVDRTVAVPPAPPAPGLIFVSDDRSDGVEISWAVVTAPSAPRYLYRVVAIGPAGESAPSADVTGSAAERPLESYEARIDGSEWSIVAPGSAGEPGGMLHWIDEVAPLATIEPPNVTATEGTYAEFVRVVATAPVVAPGEERRYDVRASTAFATGAPSAVALGQRVAGGTSLQWERSASTAPSDFSSITDAITSTYDDGGAPADGSVRWYRVVVSASGALAVPSDAVAGSRQPPPDVPGGVIASNDLVDRVTVTWQAVAGALGYHVYRDGQKLTTGAGIVAASYDDFGAPAASTAWAAPTGVQATTTDPSQVTVQWVAPSRPLGALASYEVQAVNAAGEGPRSPSAQGRRAGLALIGFDVEVTTAGGSASWVSTGVVEAAWAHTNAPGGIITGGTPSATQASRRAGVYLDISGAFITPTDVTYRVRGALQGGAFTPPSTAAIGRRAPGAIVYRWQRSAGASASSFTDIAGATSGSYVDATAPGDGAHRWYQVVISATGVSSVTPSPVEGWRLAFVAVDGGSSSTCSLDTDGRIWTWGLNSSGQLGRGNASPAPAPAQVLMPAGVTFAQVSMHGSHACARSVGGEIWCWGYGSDGAVGSNGQFIPLPTKVAGLVGVVSIAAGGSHSCATTGDGLTRCWGKAAYLGSDSTDDSVDPLIVRTSPTTELTGALAVSAGTYHACVRRALDVYCWGHNYAGQLGVSGMQTSDFAVATEGLQTVTLLALGHQFSCARLPNGSATCWGDNSKGQLGNASTTPSTSPVPVSSLGGVTMLSALNDAACALASTGVVLCWGNNAAGQLGNSGNGDSWTPVPVNTNGVTSIGVGYSHSCAVIGGGVYCWGDNTSQKLGDGTSAPRNSPVPVVFP